MCGGGERDGEGTIRAGCVSGTSSSSSLSSRSPSECGGSCLEDSEAATQLATGLALGERVQWVAMSGSAILLVAISVLEFHYFCLF